MTGSAPHDAGLAVHGAVAAEVEGGQVVVGAAGRQARHALAERGDGRHGRHVRGRHLQLTGHNLHEAPFSLPLRQALSGMLRNL